MQPTWKKWGYSAVTLLLGWALTGCGQQTGVQTPSQSSTNAKSNTAAASLAAQNNPVDPGASLHGRPAPNFTLTDQFGKQVSLKQFRGKVVVLAFVDSQCTTICPLTTQSMMDALKQLGPQADSHIQLLGIDANPTAITVSDVKNYSQVHDMMNSWHFLTGSLAQLKSVWHNYYIYTGIVDGQIDHTPALYIIDSKGHEQFLYLTPSQYGAVSAQASVLAHDIAKFLPSSVQPKLQAVNYKQPAFKTTSVIQLPAETSSKATSTKTKVSIGPGKPQLLAFFASWVPQLKQELEQLNTYAQAKMSPGVVGVDVGSTEPNATAIQTVLQQAGPLKYPIVVDKSGNIADTYKVQDLMWLTLTDGKGHIIWSHDGWLPPSILNKDVQQALSQHGVKLN